MGFTTGFTGGVTLTLSLAYLSVLAHQRNRRAQCTQLRQQSHLLGCLVEKPAIAPARRRAELAREERSSLVEAAKDRWNAELENGVRWVQRTDWDALRWRVHGAVSRAWGPGLGEGVEAGEQAVGEQRGHAGEAAAETKNALDGARVNVKEAEATTPSYPAVERKANGPVDAARPSIRNAVSRGLLAGQEMAQQAGAALGILEAKVEGTDALIAGSGRATETELERALRARSEGLAQVEKSIQQALEERYTPMDRRDDGSLGGV